MSFRLTRFAASAVGVVALPLLIALAAVVLVGCGNEKDSAAAPQAKGLSGLDIEMHYDPG